MTRRQLNARQEPLRPPLRLCVSVVKTSVPATTEHRLLRVDIHHRDTETQRGTEIFFQTWAVALRLPPTAYRLLVQS